MLPASAHRTGEVVRLGGEENVVVALLEIQGARLAGSGREDGIHGVAADGAAPG